MAGNETEIELLEDLLEDFTKFKKLQNEQLHEVNEDMASKGATLNQIQDRLKELEARGGRLGLTADTQPDHVTKQLSRLFAENHSNLSEVAKEGRFTKAYKIKSPGTMTAAANLTGSVQASYSPTPALRGRQKLHIRDVLQVINSLTGVWKFFRNNSPAGEGSFDFQTTHGNTKNQLDYDFTEVTITAEYLAGFVIFARQMAQDLPWMQSFLTSELVEDYLRAEDMKFWGQLYSAATGSTSVTSSTVTAEKIIDVIAALSENDYDPNAIIITNAGWAKLLKTKPQDYSLPGGNAITIDGNGNVTICGIPVLRTKAAYIGNNMMLIGDFTKAGIIQTEGLNVAFSDQDGTNFQKNLITARAEARVALAVLRPDAFTLISQGTT